MLHNIFTAQNYSWGIVFQYMYCASFIVLYYDQQMHNYLTKYHTPLYFDNIVSSCFTNSCILTICIT